MIHESELVDVIIRGSHINDEFPGLIGEFYLLSKLQVDLFGQLHDTPLKLL